MPQNGKMKSLKNLDRRVKFSFKLGISSLVLLLLIPKIDFREVFVLLKDIDPVLFGVRVGIMLLGIFLSSYKLRILLKNSAIGELVKLNFIGIFFNLFLPGTVGGDLYRIRYFQKNGLKSADSVSVIFFDRFTGFFALFSYFFVVVLILYLEGNLFPLFQAINLLEIEYSFFVALFFLALFFVLTFLFRKRLIDKYFLPFLASLQLILQSKRKVVGAFFIAYLTQFLSVIMFWVTLLSLDASINPSFLVLFFLVFLINIFTMLPISFRGVGIREALCFLFLPEIDFNILFSASLVSYFVYFLCGLCGFYFLNTQKKLKKYDECVF